MSLVISTGSNLGDRVNHLKLARTELSKHFNLIEESQIYESPAVDYTQQPDFLNQILSFDLPKLTPQNTIELILKIEKNLGRVRNIDKGPRSVDIDILFWDTKKISTDSLQVPHPRLFQRSFIVLPLKELDVFSYLIKSFNFPEHFDNQAWPFSTH